MKIDFDDIIDRHVDVPAVITLHGPSLNKHKHKISSLQKSNKIIRFSINNWYDYFTIPPDYWILSSAEDAFPVRKLLGIASEQNIPIFYSDEADFTDKQTIDKFLKKTEWLAYDQRHWQGKSCLQILKQFKQHHEKHKNYNFKTFGNNAIMWEPPRCYSMSGHSLKGDCCAQNNPPRITIQEKLQKKSGFHSHYSTGDSVALHAIAFAILMKCNPIYISGLDLDYNVGYAEKEKDDWMAKAQSPNAWHPVRKNLENDLSILDGSARKRGIDILTLNEQAWYNSFRKTSQIII